jgi:hypothetical protein
MLTPEKLADALMDAFRIGQVDMNFWGPDRFDDATAQEVAAVIREAMQENEAETAKGLMDLDERNAA